MKPRKVVLIYADSPARMELRTMQLDLWGYAVRPGGEVQFHRRDRRKPEPHLVVLDGTFPLEDVRDLAEAVGRVPLLVLCPYAIAEWRAGAEMALQRAEMWWVLDESAVAQSAVRERIRTMTARKRGPKSVGAVVKKALRAGHVAAVRSQAQLEGRLAA